MVENIDDIATRYRINDFGYIACGYSLDDENKIYDLAVNIISSKYSPSIISKEDLSNNIRKKGHIYTAKIANKFNVHGFEERETGNVVIEHFADKMTLCLLHELIHRAGENVSDKTFDIMKIYIKEAGTEYVAATSLSDKYEKWYCIEDICMLIPERAQTSLVSMGLLSQLNVAMQGNTLEKSILNGHDYFKERIIEKYGMDNYILLSERIEDLEIKVIQHMDSVRETGAYSRSQEQAMLSNELLDCQNYILELEFDKRFSVVKTREEALEYLMALKRFGAYRIKREVDGKISDEYLEEYFKDKRKVLSQRYGVLDVEYDEEDFINVLGTRICEDIYPEIEVNQNELDDVDQMAVNFESQSQKRVKEFNKEKRREKFRRWLGIKEEPKKIEAGSNPESFIRSIQVDSIDYTKVLDTRERNSLSREK